MKRYRFIKFIYMALIITCTAIAISVLQSCEGCSCVKGKVGGDVNIKAAKTAGEAIITLNQLNKIVASGEKKFITVTFSGSQSGNTEGTGETSFSATKNIEVTANSVNPTPVIHRYNMKPGTWKITVSAGTWSASCTKAINADQSTTFTFNFNQAGCQ